MGCFSCFKVGCNCNINIDQEVRQIMCPGRDAETLKNEMSQLKDIRVDIEKSVKEIEGEPFVEVKTEVKMWITNVDALCQKVDELQKILVGKGYWFCLRLGCCSCCSNYTLGEDVRNKLERVRQLKTQQENWKDKLVIDVRIEESEGMLKKEMKELINIKLDMERKIQELEMDPHMWRSHQVQSWLTNVSSLEVEVTIFLDRINQVATQNTQNESVNNSSPSREMAIIRGKVRVLWNRAKDFGTDLVRRASPNPVQKVLGSPPLVVGNDETLSDILGSLDDNQVKLIGIYGMGGIGKTTLLREINNSFLAATHDFDLLIWVVVTRKLDILKIQEDIGVRLGYCRQADGLGPMLPRSESDRANILAKTLSQKKYLIFLDDVWVPLDLGRIGIPLSGMNSNSKVVFTTREQHVCIDMRSQIELRHLKTVKLGFLDVDNSWSLFRSTIGREDLLQREDVLPFAKDLVKKCGGLPLALVTVARAMADKEVVSEWRAATTALNDLPSDIRGMEYVLNILKFSFDNLKNKEIRTCLLYCSLFREDEDISIPQLIEYWIGHGLLDLGHCFVDSLRDRGYFVIRDLQAACLLERGSDEEHVKLHDAVREMAIWLGRGKGGYRQKFLCCAGNDLDTVCVDETWKEIEMISLMDNRIKVLTLFNEMPASSNLHAILVKQNLFLEHLPEVLFDVFPALRIIDLSNTGVVSVPKSLGSLKSLLYLNLSNTPIEALPTELSSLVNLKLLDLSDTIDLSYIPIELIAHLQKLQSLNLFASNGIRHKKDGCAKLEDLAGLLSLDDLGFRVAEDLNDVKALLSSDKLMKATRLLELWGIRGFALSYLEEIAGKLGRLKLFEIYRCPQLNGEWVLCEKDIPSLEHLVMSELPLSNIASTCQFPFLYRLEIQGCHHLEHLAWLGHLPRLRQAKVYSCHGIVELIPPRPVTVGHVHDASGPKGFLPLKNLKLLDLRDLPSLTRIARCVVQAPSLEELWIYKCPCLKSLPFAPGPLGATRTICSRYWWEGLVWEENDSSRSNFVPSFFHHSWDEIDRD